MNSENRVALVTGAARRVGRMIVTRLAGAGWDIAFTYLSSKDDAMSLAAEVRATGRRCVAIEADLTNSSQAAAKIGDEFSGTFTRLDLLVNNASLYQPSALDQADVEQLRRFMAVHVESPLLLCKRFETLLRASKGHVINMLDLLAEKPLPQYLAYATSKAALWNLTLGLARTLAPEVTVNGVPGVVEWPKDYPAQQREQYLKRVPLGRAGTPADVAEAVLFLATTGSYLTGQILRLDGGRSLT